MLERQLGAEGYRFNDFDICDDKPAPSVAQFADEALSHALRSGEFPEEANDNLLAGQRFLGEDKYQKGL